jgi:hypothetical protein
MIQLKTCESCGSENLATEQKLAGHLLCPRCLQALENGIEALASLQDRQPGERTSLSLDATRVEQSGILVATYKGSHSTPGRQGTTLDFTFDLKIDLKLCPGRIRIDNLNFGELIENSPAAALTKLGAWLQRAALSLQSATRNLSRLDAAVVMLPVPLPYKAKEAAQPETTTT